MSSSHPNDKNMQIIRRRQRISNQFEHAEYAYWLPEWRVIRDCILGEVEIKRKGKIYLPKMSGQDDDEYLSYLERATFYNMCSRTVNGLVGTIFRREPKLINLPNKFKESINKITKDNMSLSIFSKQITQEIITLGRYGVLMDMPTSISVTNIPYFAGYLAENIIDWTVEDVDGRYELVEVILREIKNIRPRVGSGRSVTSIKYASSYRVLKLVDGEYQQHIYNAGPTGDADLSQPPDDIIIPTNRGKPFNFIPFKFFGPWTNSPDVEKSPLLDIALLNLSHYQSYGQLEHGRFYTALPVYFAQIAAGAEGGTYTIGPSVVWEVEEGQRPGIIEYNGHGLIFLEKALDQKEQQISNIGGRMLGVRGTAVAESDNLVKLREKNEQSLLLNVTTTVNEGLSEMLVWWMDWQDTVSKDTKIELNQDFLFDNLRAREFRAISQMYESGILPIDVVYEVFLKAEIIPEYMTMEEFKQKLDDKEQFPNQADVLAKMEGYADADAKDAEKAALTAAKVAKEVAATQDKTLVRSLDEQKQKEEQNNDPDNT